MATKMSELINVRGACLRVSTILDNNEFALDANNYAALVYLERFIRNAKSVMNESRKLQKKEEYKRIEKMPSISAVFRI